MLLVQMLLVNIFSTSLSEIFLHLTFCTFKTVLNCKIFAKNKLQFWKWQVDRQTKLARIWKTFLIRRDRPRTRDRTRDKTTDWSRDRTIEKTRLSTGRKDRTREKTRDRTRDRSRDRQRDRQTWRDRLNQVDSRTHLICRPWDKQIY